MKRPGKRRKAGLDGGGEQTTADALATWKSRGIRAFPELRRAFDRNDLPGVFGPLRQSLWRAYEREDDPAAEAIIQFFSASLHHEDESIRQAALTWFVAPLLDERKDKRDWKRIAWWFHFPTVPPEAWEALRRHLSAADWYLFGELGLRHVGPHAHRLNVDAKPAAFVNSYGADAERVFALLPELRHIVDDELGDWGGDEVGTTLIPGLLSEYLEQFVIAPSTVETRSAIKRIAATIETLLGGNEGERNFAADALDGLNPWYLEETAQLLGPETRRVLDQLGEPAVTHAEAWRSTPGIVQEAVEYSIERAERWLKVSKRLRPTPMSLHSDRR